MIDIRMPKMAIHIHAETEINKDPNASAAAPWVMRPTPGTWLALGPMSANALGGAWSIRSRQTKWEMAACLDITNTDPALTPAYLKLLAEDLAQKPVPEPVIFKLKASMGPCMMALPMKRQLVPRLPLGNIHGWLMDVELDQEEMQDPAVPLAGERGPLPPQLVNKRQEALRFEALCREQRSANVDLQRESEGLREELARLLNLGSPNDTPIGTQR